ncbi:MAG: hypothetical protein R2761_16995 [Acidimicrobiales bacterium]
MAHLVYGIAVDSDLPLAAPPVATPASLRIAVRSGPVPDPEVRWLDDPDDADCACGRLPDGRFLLRFEGVADFVIDPAGTSIDWWSPDGPSALLVHLALDHALPQAMMRRGRLVLHASCLVSPGGRCYAVVGESGRGKSTLAAVLSSRGHRFVADDCAVIDLVDGVPRVTAAYPELRLHGTSLAMIDTSGIRPAGIVSELGGKVRLALSDQDRWNGWADWPLDAIVVLAPSPPAGGGLHPLAPGEALIALLRQSFHLTDGGRERLDLLDRLAHLVDACGVLTTHYEHTLAGLEQVVEDIERHVGTDGPG